MLPPSGYYSARSLETGQMGLTSAFTGFSPSLVHGETVLVKHKLLILEKYILMPSMTSFTIIFILYWVLR